MAKLRGGDGWSLQPASSGDAPPPSASLPPAEQRIAFRLERRGKGKVVTVVAGLTLTPADLEVLAKKLKRACGTGGTARPGAAGASAVELQGDCRTRATSWLREQGYRS